MRILTVPEYKDADVWDCSLDLYYRPCANPEPVPFSLMDGRVNCAAAGLLAVWV